MGYACVYWESQYDGAGSRFLRNVGIFKQYTVPKRKIGQAFD